MKKIKSLLSLLLALTILFFEIQPIVVHAGMIEDAPIEDAILTQDEAEVYKQQIKNIRDEVNSLEIEKEEDKKLVEDFNAKSIEISENIDMSVQKIGISDIYDISSIPERLVLLGRLGRAIRFATTTLRNKVDEAHAEIAEYIFVGLVKAASPFSSIEDMKNHILEFEVLKAKLLLYPDISLNDTANIYVKADLDAKLNKARFMKFNELKNKPTYVIKALDKEIAEITGERLRPRATVSEIYALSDRLDQAVAEAQNNEDETASRSEIRKLKEKVRECKMAIRNGDERLEVSAAIDRANQELLFIKPSKIVVTGLIQTMDSLMY